MRKHGFGGEKGARPSDGSSGRRSSSDWRAVSRKRATVGFERDRRSVARTKSFGAWRPCVAATHDWCHGRRLSRASAKRSAISSEVSELHFHGFAQLDLLETALFYETKRVGHGTKFEKEVELLLEQIRDRPESGKNLGGYPEETQAQAFYLSTLSFCSVRSSRRRRPIGVRSRRFTQASGVLAAGDPRSTQVADPIIRH